MKVKLTPSKFIRLLHAARSLDREFPWLGQATWLLDHWTDSKPGRIMRAFFPE